MTYSPNVLWFSMLPVLAAPCVAQAVSAAVTTATPMQVRASSSGVNTTSAWPVNTAGLGIVEAQTPAAVMHSQWVDSAYSLEAQVSWNQQADVYEVAPAYAETLPSELVATFQASGSVPVVIELSRTLGATPGSPMPAFGIDVGDDGTFELTEVGPATITLSTVLSTVPLTVRLRSQITQVGPGSIDLGLRVRVRPDNNLLVNQVVVPCPFVAGALYAEPTFEGRGVECFIMNAWPSVLVIGLGVQPLPLPPLASGGQCLLLPSPDLATYLPFGQHYTLPLPSALRPAVLWLQAVALTSGGLGTTNAFTAVTW